MQVSLFAGSQSSEPFIHPACRSKATPDNVAEVKAILTEHHGYTDHRQALLVKAIENGVSVMMLRMFMTTTKQWAGVASQIKGIFPFVERVKHINPDTLPVDDRLWHERIGRDVG